MKLEHEEQSVGLKRKVTRVNLTLTEREQEMRYFQLNPLERLDISQLIKGAEMTWLISQAL